MRIPTDSPDDPLPLSCQLGRYKAGEKEPDPKTWKANFRCAMNSLPDIEEVKDQSRNKGSSAVRVYRMLPPLTKSQRKGTQRPLGPGEALREREPAPKENLSGCQATTCIQFNVLYFQK